MADWDRDTGLYSSPDGRFRVFFPSAPVDLCATRGSVHYLLEVLPADSSDHTRLSPRVQLHGQILGEAREQGDGELRLRSQTVVVDGQPCRYNRLLTSHGEEILFRVLRTPEAAYQLTVWGPVGALEGGFEFLYSVGPGKGYQSARFQPTACLFMPSCELDRSGQPVEKDGRMARRGSSPWLRLGVPAERRLTLSALPRLLEVDSVEQLRASASPNLAGFHHFVAYQHWDRDRDGSGVRLYRVFDEHSAVEVAEAIKRGPLRSLILMVVGFAPGALARLGEALQPHSLDLLGLFYCLGGDDITDTPDIPREIGAVVQRLGVRRLSILTGAFHGDCEAELAKALRESRTLVTCSVFLKDPAQSYPRLPTAGLDKALQDRFPVPSMPTHPNVSSKVEQARKLASTGNLEGALSHLQATSREHPGNPEVMLGIALVSRIMGRKADALAALDTAIQHNPKEPELYYERSIVGQDDRAALHYLSLALKQDPSYQPAWCNRGVAHWRLGEAAEALRDLNQALLLKPDDSIALLNRAELHLAQGRWEEARSDADLVVALGRHPKAAEAATQMLGALGWRGNLAPSPQPRT